MKSINLKKPNRLKLIKILEISTIIILNIVRLQDFQVMSLYMS